VHSGAAPVASGGGSGGGSSVVPGSGVWSYPLPGSGEGWTSSASSRGGSSSAWGMSSTSVTVMHASLGQNRPSMVGISALANRPRASAPDPTSPNAELIRPAIDSGLRKNHRTRAKIRPQVMIWLRHPRNMRTPQKEQADVGVVAGQAVDHAAMPGASTVWHLHGGGQHPPLLVGR